MTIPSSYPMMVILLTTKHVQAKLEFSSSFPPWNWIMLYVLTGMPVRLHIDNGSRQRVPRLNVPHRSYPVEASVSKPSSVPNFDARKQHAHPGHETILPTYKQVMMQNWPPYPSTLLPILLMHANSNGLMTFYQTSATLLYWLMEFISIT